MSPAPDQRLPKGLMWFRRDLRTEDNAALFHALKRCDRVWCVFLLDKAILDPLPRADRRVEFIVDSLAALDADLKALGGKGAGLIVHHGWATDVVGTAKQLGVQAVFANHDDEPDALARDAQVRGQLAGAGVSFNTFKDHVIFERQEVMTQASAPFSVFTPYKNAWLKRIDDFYLRPYPCAKYAQALAPLPEAFASPVPGLEAVGFERSNLRALGIVAGAKGGQALLADFVPRMHLYEQARNFPAVKGPSYLGVHLRFGTVSIRALARLAFDGQRAGDAGAGVWLSELIWRDFYAQVLANFPHVAQRAFKPAYDSIDWEKGKTANALFAAWCEGRTGYPLVDAAMAQINQTGYMHNRLRMVVASFLTKDLGLDWRWGERYFALHLNDFDLSANNGGWQWAASSGCDAQPYFRVFNPTRQSEKFDADGKFIRRYLPVLAKLPAQLVHAPWLAPPLELQAAGVRLGDNYPLPIVAHDEARLKTLSRYAVVKIGKEPGR